MVLSQNSNKFHKLKQITKQRKVNIQHRVKEKNDYDILIFRDKYPIFCKQTLQSLHKHKSGVQVLITCLNSLILYGMALSHNFEPMYYKLSNP